MQGDIVAQGVELMLFGMGTVVIFLALLVLATTAMSALVSRHFPEPEAPAAPRRASASRPDDTELVAVISAAVQQHRQRHRK